MKFIPKILFPLLLFILNFSENLSIEIQDADEVQFVVVENGTAEWVVLDCPYTLDEDDKAGLVVKWYFGGEDNPFFQWIPQGQIDGPQLLDFEDHLDMDYVVSEDPHHAHRALKFVTPTTDVHGLYTCEVSSHFDEKKVDINLIVYVLSPDLFLTVNETDDDNITVSCSSDPTFPKPDVSVSLVVDDTSSELDAAVEITAYDGVYMTDLTAEVPAEMAAAAPVVTFLCSLSIPDTNISISRELKYRADGLPITEETSEETVIEEAVEDPEDVEVLLAASTHRHSEGNNSGGDEKPLLLYLLLTALLPLLLH